MQTTKSVPPQQITWTQTEQATIAQKYIYKLYISEESGIKTTITLTNTLCGPVTYGSQCSTALPANGNVAIITGNQSQITATNPTNKMESSLSIPFVGNQGCIFQTNLYAISAKATAESNKGQLNRLLDEFKQAKFKHISTTEKGSRYVVIEECVGYIVH
jgi:hypothetical protein